LFFHSESIKSAFENWRSQIATLKTLLVKSRKFLRFQIGTLKRIPKMFELAKDEIKNLRSQFATSKEKEFQNDNVGAD
jgi:hypothetical protein